MIASVALGVGLNAAVVSVAASILERPLPFDRPSELVQFGRGTLSHREVGGLSWEFLDQDISAWRSSLGLSQPFAVVAADERVVSGEATPEYAVGATATSNLMNVLGVRLSLGRWFSDNEARDRVVVLSEGLWQRQFASDASAIGRLIRLQGEPWTVIGVVPGRVGFPLNSQYWVPWRGNLGQVVARVPRGTDLRALESRLSLLSPSVSNLQKAGHETSIAVVNLRDRLFGDAKPGLRLLVGASMLLLLVACANMAGLCINRNVERGREFAIRLALGETRRSIIGDVAIETLFLSTGGAVVGSLAAFWFGRVMVAVAPQNMTRSDAPAVSAVHIGMVGVFGILIVLIASVFISAVPSETALRGLLSGSGLGLGKGRHSRMREGLVIVQLALALVLVTGLGLLTRTIGALTRPEHVGFKPANIVVATLRLGGERYAQTNQKAEFLARLSQRVRRLPSVQELGVGPAPLVAGSDERVREGFNSMFVYHDSTKLSGSGATVWVKHIDASYFHTYGMQMHAGRALAISDDSTAQPVAILNETAAKLFFPAGDAVGRHIRAAALERPDGGAITVVGVVGDALQRGLATTSSPEIFLPLAQQAVLSPFQTISVRVSGEPLVTIAGIRMALRDLDRDLAATRLEPMSVVVVRSLATHRFLSVLLAGFAILAISLASIGLYGVMSYMVQRRSAEFGVRMALGASRRHVLMIVWHHTAILVAAGLFIGAGGAFAGARLMARFIYGISNYDKITFGLAPCVIVLFTVAAALIPASRAVAVDPCRAIRASLE